MKTIHEFSCLKMPIEVSAVSEPYDQQKYEPKNIIIHDSCGYDIETGYQDEGGDPPISIRLRPDSSDYTKSMGGDFSLWIYLSKNQAKILSRHLLALTELTPDDDE